jgi:hypothetical protein
MLMLLAILIFSVPQEQKIVTCIVTKPNVSVVCVLEHTKRKMKGIVFPVSNLDLDEWRLRAPMQGEGVNSDAPLFKEPLVKHQEVKAIIDGHQLIPVASCKVRVWRKLKEYTSNHPGDRVPFMLRTEPDDCQPWYGKN